SGKININNTDLNELSAAKKDHFVGQNVGIVFQKNHAIRSLNLIENLKARLYFSKKTINEDLILNLLQELELEDLKGKATNQISVGQMQRLNIALAVVHKPNVILADEPTSSLDDKNCEAVMNLLLNQAKQKQANLVVITHDYRVKAMFKNVLSL
ncbi:MAG: ATP-binding cassette domain-containing protein, partial [Bacteroidota bacterium]